MAPTVSVEQLTYAVRLMNTASMRGRDAALMLRDWFVDSDSSLDPQAYVLRPDIVLKLAKEVIAEPTPYLRTRRAALATLECLRKAHMAGEVNLRKNEHSWLDRLSTQADELPEDENTAIENAMESNDKTKIRLDQYDLAAFV